MPGDPPRNTLTGRLRARTPFGWVRVASQASSACVGAMAEEPPGGNLRLELDLQLDAGGGGAVRKKRKQALKPGRDMCFFPDCRGVHGLGKYPRERDADVQLRLRLPPHNLSVDVTYGGSLKFEGMLCPLHLPELCEHQVT